MVNVINKYLGRRLIDNKVVGGGFAFKNNEWKFNSWTFNVGTPWTVAKKEFKLPFVPILLISINSVVLTVDFIESSVAFEVNYYSTEQNILTAS